MRRVAGVLNSWLAKRTEESFTEGEDVWLVGNKITYADLMFVTWNAMVDRMIQESGREAGKIGIRRLSSLIIRSGILL